MQLKLRAIIRILKLLKKLKKLKIPVMGHIGFTPQFNNRFKVKGKIQKKSVS